MNIQKLALLSLFAAIILVAGRMPAAAELRFGPWVYYAPYYLAPLPNCPDYCVTAMDFVPKYQSPNPLPPPREGFCPPPAKRSGRVKSSVARRPDNSVAIPVRTTPVETPVLRPNRPAPNAPRIVPTTPPNPQGQPGAFNRGFAPGDQYRPRQVGSRPGLSAGLAPQY